MLTFFCVHGLSGDEIMQTAMNKIQGSEAGLVTVIYDILNSGETVATTKRGEATHDKEQGPPLRQGAFNRLVGLLLECRQHWLLQQLLSNSFQTSSAYMPSYSMISFVLAVVPARCPVDLSLLQGSGCPDEEVEIPLRDGDVWVLPDGE